MKQQICVKECPTGDFDELSCNSVLNFEALKQKLVCEHKKIYDKINNCGQLRNAVQNKDCVGWYENTYECEYAKFLSKKKLNLFLFDSVWCMLFPGKISKVQ